MPCPFAENSIVKNDIPAEPVGGSSNLASWRAGFPPITMIPIEAGGISPSGADFHGILNAISRHTFFQQAGGQYRFDAELSVAIGGYPKGTVLQTNDGKSSYVSLIDNNTTDFNDDPSSIGIAWAPWAGSVKDQVNADWNAASGKAQILNKPHLSAVALSGNYNDLSGKPDLSLKADKTQLAGYLPLTGGTMNGNITTGSFGTRYGIGEYQCLTFINNEADQDFEHVPVLFAGYDANNHARYALTRRGEIVSEVTFNGQYLGRRRIPSIVEKGGTVNWYRKWSDGWLEQGGYFSASDSLQSIVFALPYKNGDYTLTIGTIRSAVNSSNVVIQDKLASFFNVFSTDGNAGNWHACGWGV